LHTVAHEKVAAYADLRIRARWPEAWRVTPEAAAQRIAAGARPVSMWKHAAA
jgi:hypothetical protein